MALCLVVSPNVRGNYGRKSKEEMVVGQGEKKREYSGTALFCGKEGSYVRGEAGSHVHWDLHHMCWCADRGQWPHPCAGLAITVVEVCQPRTDSLEKGKGWLFLAENPCSFWSHLETCESHESYSLFCCRALKVDDRWNKFILWLFHFSAESVFYLCLRDLTHLLSYTVLSLPFLFFLDFLIIETPKSNVRLLSLFRHTGAMITCSTCRHSHGRHRDSLDQWFKFRLKPLSLQVLSVGCRAVEMSDLSWDFVPRSAFLCKERCASRSRMGGCFPAALPSPAPDMPRLHQHLMPFSK